MKSFDCFNEQHLELDELLYEEGLRDWFGKSKSKDGKKGWVNVVTGDSCASDKPGEGVPKCVSSEKRASMSKGERKAAQAAKRREDPGQQSKSGAAKPTNVKTDRNVKEEYKDPVHYALKADKELMKLHTKDDKKKKEEYKDPVHYALKADKELMKLHTKDDKKKKKDVKEACWDTHEQRGMKKKGGKMVPNCVKKEEYMDERAGQIGGAILGGVAGTAAGSAVAPGLGTALGGYAGAELGGEAGKKLDKWAEKKRKEKEMKKKMKKEEYVSEGEAWTKKEGQNKEGGLNEKGRKSYEAANPGSDLKAPSKKKGNKRRASFCARMKGMKKKLTSAKTASDPDSRINKSLRAWNCGYEMGGENHLSEDETGRRSSSGHANPVDVGRNFAQNMPSLGTGMIDPGGRGGRILPPNLMPGKPKPGINLKRKPDKA